MSDYLEIDFLDVEVEDSGDVILLRYKFSDQTRINFTDGEFQRNLRL